MLLFEGGTFIWPGVRVGHRQTVPLLRGGNPDRAAEATGDRRLQPQQQGEEQQEQEQQHGTATLETLSMEPLVLAIDGFLGLDECDYIRRHSEPHVRQSGVSLMDKDRGKVG